MTRNRVYSGIAEELQFRKLVLQQAAEESVESLWQAVFIGKACTVG